MRCINLSYLAHSKTFAHKYFKSGNFDKALAIYKHLLEFTDNKSEIYTNIASVNYFKNNFSEALNNYLEAIKQNPQYAEAHTFLSMVYLILEDFENGWNEYEWRIKSNQFYDSLSEFERFKWDGSSLNGGKIIVKAEQGFGDTIQFLRYLPLVKEKSKASIVFHCPIELRELLVQNEAIDLLITEEEAIEGCRACVYLGSLPKIFNTNLQNIPSTFPYIKPNSLLQKKWAEYLKNDPNMKVGFVYTGNPQNAYNNFRSIPLEKLLPIFKETQISFYSLQKGDANKQLDSLNLEGLEVYNLEEQINSFADTAAIIENLDLVISVDTSVAHLAGAMNKPTYLMLSSAHDWRWLTKRNDSPWYPSMKIFRQNNFQDWSVVIQDLQEELNEFKQQFFVNKRILV